MLADLDGGAAALALQEILATSKWPPTIADIRERVAHRRIAAPDIGAAWEEVRLAVNCSGDPAMDWMDDANAKAGLPSTSGAPTWSHPVITAAVRTMGWDDFRMSKTEDVATWRAQFERYYKARLDTMAHAENVGQLEAHQKRTGQVTAGAAVARLIGKAP
jgi:hypothetical protein